MGVSRFIGWYAIAKVSVGKVEPFTIQLNFAPPTTKPRITNVVKFGNMLRSTFRGWSTVGGLLKISRQLAVPQRNMDIIVSEWLAS